MGGATATSTPALRAERTWDISGVNPNTVSLPAYTRNDSAQTNGRTGWSVQQQSQEPFFRSNSQLPPESLFTSNHESHVMRVEQPNTVVQSSSMQPQIQASSLYASTYGNGNGNAPAPLASYYADSTSGQSQYGGGGGYNSNMLQQKKVQHKLTEQSLWSSRSSEHLYQSNNYSSSNGQTYSPANRAPK